MRKEDYQKVIADLEIHYQEFIRNSQGSEMFGDDDKRKIQTQFTDAQKHYQTLVIQLPGQQRPVQPQTGWLSIWMLGNIPFAFLGSCVSHCRLMQPETHLAKCSSSGEW